jgi:large subunit ribosomal protein L5
MANPMRDLRIEKVTVNIGTGSPGEKLDNAKELLKRLTKRTPMETQARKRNPVWKLRQGMPIGTKVTLRKKPAVEFLQKALIANRRPLKVGNFDASGNFSFGVREYIDFPEAKYDPRIGMMGFDVCVTVARRGGSRVADRKIRKSKSGKKQRITREEAIEFAKSLNAKVEE